MACFMSWIGGRIDRRIGPKPVIVAAVLVLILVCSVILNMTDASLFGMALPEGSTLRSLPRGVEALVTLEIEHKLALVLVVGVDDDPVPVEDGGDHRQRDAVYLSRGAGRCPAAVAASR